VEAALAGASRISIVDRDPQRGSELVDLINKGTPARAELVVWDRTIASRNRPTSS
jgi:shikimate dehydrogenase